MNGIKILTGNFLVFFTIFFSKLPRFGAFEQGKATNTQKIKLLRGDILFEYPEQLMSAILCPQMQKY